MARSFIILVLSFLFLKTSVSAQLREMPAEVKEAFGKQYPDAESPEFKDNIVLVKVHFSKNGEKMIATYNNKGMWRDTEKDWNFDHLPEDVKDGFQKSKYAEWNITETKIIYLPGGNERYRVKVGKNDIQKKYLFFNKKGRLVEDTITI